MQSDDIPYDSNTNVPNALRLDNNTLPMRTDRATPKPKEDAGGL